MLNSNIKQTTNKAKKPESMNLNPNNIRSSIKKYPRSAIIGGKQWIRNYSASDKKYYWLYTDNKTNKQHKEWDPWRLNNKKAPWMKYKQEWCKFFHPKSKKCYFYNYTTKISTFTRPNEYESDEEINYDSAQ